ncbi:MAG: glycosyltransferase [Gammaproteobacteria bacterium]
MSRLRDPVTIVLRVSVPESAVREMLAVEGVVSIIVATRSESLAACYPGRVGWYLEDEVHWLLPERVAQEMVYVGHPWEFGFRAARSAWRAGIRSFRSLADAKQPFLRRTMTRVLTTTLLRSVSYRVHLIPLFGSIEQYSALNVRWLARKIASLERKPLQAVERRIVMVIGGLGAGGSEQQAVHTLQGLLYIGYTDLALLHEQPMQPPHDFFVGRLRGTPIAVDQLRPLFLHHPHEWVMDADFVHIMEAVGMNSSVCMQILSYVAEFRVRRPQVVHTWLDSVNVTAGVAAVLAGVPRVVVSCRSVAPIHFKLYQPHMKPLYRFLASCRNVILLNNSSAGAKDYCRWLGLNPDVFRVVHNGFDFSRVPPGDELERRILELRRRWGVSAVESVVGTVIRLSEEKRPLLWVEAAAEIASRDQSVKFVILGDGPYRDKVLEAVQRLGLAEKVVLVGYEADAVSSIAAMDVFLLTSRMEGLPNVLIEAQAVGVAVVTASVGGAPETFEHGVTGLSVPDANARALAEAVLHLLHHTDLREAARVRAPPLVRDRFGTDGMLRGVLRTYGFDQRYHEHPHQT